MAWQALKPGRLSLQTRLVLTSLLGLILAPALAAVLARVLIVGASSPAEVVALRDRLPAIERSLAAGADSAALKQVALPADLPPSMRVRLVATDGTVRVDSAGDAAANVAAQDVFGWLVQPDEPGGVLVSAVPVTVNGQAWGYYVAVGAGPRGPLGTSIGLLAIVVALPLLIGVLPFWWFGRGLVRTIHGLTSVVGQIAAGDLAARVKPKWQSDELGRLAYDVNAMAANLQAAQAHVRAADEARRFTVAAISHDLRTPLAALLAHVEAARAGVSEPERSLEVIQDRALRLQTLVDDLFELAALDAATEPWLLQPTDLTEVVRQAVAAALPGLEAAGMELDIDIPDEPLWADLAPGKLDRVIDNLLVNARSYAADGGWVGVRVARLNVDLLRVEVMDRGIGIPVAERSRVFERFYRSDGARHAAGSGLGLAIAREMIQRHGGTIAADSPPAGGTRVWFEIPACKRSPNVSTA
jgi:signal transduction histidine kinase